MQVYEVSSWTDWKCYWCQHYFTRWIDSVLVLSRLICYFYQMATYTASSQTPRCFGVGSISIFFIISTFLKFYCAMFNYIRLNWQRKYLAISEMRLMVWCWQSQMTLFAASCLNHLPTKNNGITVVYGDISVVCWWNRFSLMAEIRSVIIFTVQSISHHYYSLKKTCTFNLSRNKKILTSWESRIPTFPQNENHTGQSIFYKTFSGQSGAIFDNSIKPWFQWPLYVLIRLPQRGLTDIFGSEL